jgi:uncharacterized membrane protein
VSSKFGVYVWSSVFLTKCTYVYLSLLRLIITGFIEKSTKIEERLLHIWTIVFTFRLWWTWIQHMQLKDIIGDKNLESIKSIQQSSLLQN